MTRVTPSMLFNALMVMGGLCLLSLRLDAKPMPSAVFPWFETEPNTYDDLPLAGGESHDGKDTGEVGNTVHDTAASAFDWLKKKYVNMVDAVRQGLDVIGSHDVKKSLTDFSSMLKNTTSKLTKKAERLNELASDKMHRIMDVVVEKTKSAASITADHAKEFRDYVQEKLGEISIGDLTDKAKLGMMERIEEMKGLYSRVQREASKAYDKAQRMQNTLSHHFGVNLKRFTRFAERIGSKLTHKAEDINETISQQVKKKAGFMSEALGNSGQKIRQWGSTVADKMKEKYRQGVDFFWDMFN